MAVTHLGNYCIAAPDLAGVALKTEPTMMSVSMTGKTLGLHVFVGGLGD